MLNEMYASTYNFSIMVSWFQGSQTSYSAVQGSQRKCSCEQGGRYMTFKDLASEVT